MQASTDCFNLQFMETHLVNHFACGDIVRFPSRYSIASSCQLGHWGLAQKMGRTTAFKMMGRDESIFNTVPFFWTNVGGMTIRYVGKKYSLYCIRTYVCQVVFLPINVC